MAAARQAALFALDARSRTFAGLLASAAERPIREELESASAEQLLVEARKLWTSVTSAQLLLAGTLSHDAAEAASALVRNELRAVLPAAKATRQVPPWSASAELQRWDHLLYQPAWIPSSKPSPNFCLSPAVAGTLDQCGGLQA